MKSKISKDIYERYIDAATALFMEHYGRELDDVVQKEMTVDTNEFAAIPKDLDDRCRDLIKKNCVKHQQIAYWKNVRKVMKYAASVAVILLATASILFMTVEAVRIPIIRYYMEHSNGYWEISSKDAQGDKNTDITKLNIDLSDPLAGLIPEEYGLVVLDGQSLNRLTAIYEDNSGNEIFFSAEDSNSNLQLDSEGAQVSQIYKHCNKDIVLVVEGTNVRLAWIDEELSVTFTLIATNMSSDLLLNIAEQLINMIS